jgi:hypothetical protein
VTGHAGLGAPPFRAGDLALWLLLALIMFALVLAAWWPTRRGNGGGVQS